MANTISITGIVRQIQRVGSFELPCSADTAFPFFSPEGERKWVEGWDPKPVFPENIAFSRDTVFIEGCDDAQALWTILNAAWATHTAEYVRLVPASHSAHIVVKIESAEHAASRVEVSYTVTAFGEQAADLLRAFSEDAYAAKMRDWQRRIRERLAHHNSEGCRFC